MSEKKLSISKKTVLIASALVLAVGLPIAYLLWTSNQEDTGAWYNSSWLYRRSISVANPGSTLTNEDVLIEYDTATLVTAGKLQSDCDDLRFIDSDDSTALAYWVEGGCNTSTTHIWVRIPSLPSGGKTIYMYYGNTSATNAEETWTGEFYLMKNAACDSGWTTESDTGGDFNLKFPYPASTFGTTGGSSSHDHGSVSLTSSTYSVGSNTTNSTGNTIAAYHNHSVSVPVETNSSVLPTYLDMIFCSNNDLVVKQYTVAIFTSTVSSPFTQFSALDSAFPRGNSSYTGTQGGSTTHTHTTTSVASGGPSATDVCLAGATAVPSGTHTHTFASSTTTAGNHIPIYMTVIFGQAGSDTMAPPGTIVMSNNTPPLGWTRYSALDGYFTFGATSYGTTGGNSTHTHDISISSGSESSTVGCTTTANPKLTFPRTHTHTATGTTGTYSNNPPYISTLFIQKKTSQSVTVNNEEVPNQAPSAPTSLLTETATNPTGVTDLQPEFSAIYSDPDSDDGIHYEIEVNTASDFTGTVMWDSGQLSTGPITSGNRSSDIEYAPTNLTQNGTTYYWRIRFWDDNGAVSDWSSTANFTMASANNNPDTPSSLYTENTANPIKVEDATPEFSAVFTDTDTGDTGTHYEIEVNTSSDFTGTVMWDSDQQSITAITNGARSSDISYGVVGTPVTLTFNGATYYWRIKFWDNNGAASNWSSTGQFTMSGVPYAPSSLQTEGSTNPTGVTDTTPEFTAIHTDPNSDSTTHYEIEVNTLSNFAGTVMWDSGQQTITVANNARSSEISYGIIGTPETLTLDGSTYYWRIRFWDASGVSNWSSTAQFTMYSNTFPNAPSSPYTEASTNPTKVTDDTPEFSAVFTDTNGSDTGTHYEIEVNTASDFTGTVMWDSGQQTITAITNGARSSDISYGSVGTSETLTFNGATYYWRIKFWDNYDAESTWSSTAQFTMSGPPNAPSSLQTEGATNPIGVTDLTPEFSAIHTDPNADSTSHYEIEVNTQSDFLGTSMWDTDQQATTVANNTRSSEISYDGTTLTLNGATYYWRIRFWDTVSTVGEWSSTGQFTMQANIAPDAPSSLLTEDATNPTGVTDTTPEFSAVFTDSNTLDTASYYEIEVNTQSDFLGTSMWDTGQLPTSINNGDRSSNFSYTGTTLTPNGSTYYWRIRFWDVYDAVSNWSSTAQFTMATNTLPNAPSSLYTESATNPTKVTDLTPEFSAIFSDTDSGDTGTHYEIEVNTASDFTGTVMWDSTQQSITPITNGSRSSDIAYNGTALTENGTTYYWRIKFWDNYGGESNWSSTGQFTMSGVPYAPSSLETEGSTNPTGVTDTTPEFTAIHTDPNADSTTHYEIEVNTQSDFLGTSMWDTNQQTITVANNTRSTEISYAGTTLTLNSTTYYWRIRFWDTLGVSEWSSTGQFTMAAPGNNAPDAPTSLYTEGATNPVKVTDLTPEFSAVFTDTDTGDTGTHYEIEVNTSSDFTGTVMWDSGQQTITAITNGARSSDISYNGTTLTENGTTYYWRIKFWDDNGAASVWSSVAQFTMSGVPYAPSSLQTEGTTNPTDVTDSTPEFSAIHTDPNGDSTTHYEIEVNTNSSFTGTVMWDSNQQSITVANNARSSDISYNGSTLNFDGTTYYWRIRFWDSISTVSDWSSTGQFTMHPNTVPNAPSSPYTEASTNPTKVTDDTPEFSAVFTDTNGSDTGTHYEIEVNTASDFTGTVMWDSGQQTITAITNGARSSDISYGSVGTSETLTFNGATYYWRIKFWDNYEGESSWSSTAQFTMSGPPNAPSSLQTEGVTNPTGVTDLTPEFSAIHTDPNADSTTHYEIEVNTQSDFLGTSMWDTDQQTITVANNARSSEISYDGTTLTLNGTTYYWRIRFWDSVSTVGEWSSVSSFTMGTNTPPNAPSSLYTETTTNPTKVEDATPEFSAVFTDTNGSDTGTHYEIEVNSNDSFTGTVMWDSGQQTITAITNGARSSDISYGVVGTPVTLTFNGATYYWRIKFWDNNGSASNWSSTGSFTMSGPPAAPSNLKTDNMTNPTQILTITPDFKAYHLDPNGDSAIYYEIEVNTQSDFLGTSMWDTGQVAMTSTPSGQYSPNITYAGTTLTGESNTTYYWRIRFWDSISTVSEWSSTVSFVDYIQDEQYIQMEGVGLERIKIN